MLFDFAVLFGFKDHPRGLQSKALATIQSATLAVMLLAGFAVSPAHAQYAPPPPPPPPTPDQGAGAVPQEPAQSAPLAPPPLQAPQQLDQLVSRIALYPDPLLAQILTGATFYYEIPDAANWANQHGNLSGDALALAIQQDNLPWDPSVLALLPFPSVLNMMAQDPAWTQQLGDAVLAQRPDVMDAVQRMRQQAYNYGYLRPTPYDNVVYNDGYVQILPVNPYYLYVPVYSPAVVFAAPRPGFAIGLAIHFSPSIIIGPAFVPFGWARPGFAWGTHAIVIGGVQWGRTWANRATYVHAYPNSYRVAGGPRVEYHPSENHAPANHGGPHPESHHNEGHPH
jgi:hypothetical protein